mmetsp:Transcript_122743/g.342012  ORF Transcript_122743/g.342012 Transcript_122743/m.342012 type:complete len:618 (-) Transcript_122743:104-1957(-)
MKCQRRTDTSFGNSVVARRELMQKQQQHRQRINEIKSTLDTRAPAPQPHLTLYGRDYVQKKKATTEAAFSDLKMIQSIARTMTRKRAPTERKGPVSLNADARKQEIYNIMHANHKLLDSIEQVAPVMRTKDLIRDHREKIRYVINSSHTMRLSGEYDPEIDRIHKEDRMKFEATQRSTRMKMDAAQRLRSSNGSVSLPSLTATTRSDPGQPKAPPSRGRTGAAASSTAPAKQAGGSFRTMPRSRSEATVATVGSREPDGKPDDLTAVAARPSVHFSSGASKPTSPQQKPPRDYYAAEIDVPREVAEGEAQILVEDTAAEEDGHRSTDERQEEDEQEGQAGFLDKVKDLVEPALRPLRTPDAESRHREEDFHEAEQGEPGQASPAAAKSGSWWRQEAPSSEGVGRPGSSARGTPAPASEATERSGALAPTSPWARSPAARPSSQQSRPRTSEGAYYDDFESSGAAGGTAEPAEQVSPRSRSGSRSGSHSRSHSRSRSGSRSRSRSRTPSRSPSRSRSQSRSRSPSRSRSESEFEKSEGSPRPAEQAGASSPAGAPSPAKQEPAALEADYDEDYEEDYEDDFADESNPSLNATKSSFKASQSKEALDALEESDGFEESG